MIDVRLIFDYGFKWHHAGNAYVKGFLFDTQNHYYAGDALLNYFKEITTIKQFEENIQQANGLFSIILIQDSQLFAAVDRLRSFPIFYHLEKDLLTLSDSADWLRRKFKIRELSDFQMLAFRSSGFVSGDDTLAPGIFQVQTGAYLKFSDKGFNQKFYHHYYTDSISELNFTQAAEKLTTQIRESFNRFVKTLRGRTVALSLSGGYDSRLIAVMLRETDYKNVLCYTYGRKDSKEISLAKRTAETLGFPWIFIEHNRELVDNFLNDPYFEQYFAFSANFTSMFFLESYFALKHIKQNKLVPDDAIFTCGHSGDFLAGSQLVKNGDLRDKATLKKISSQIAKRKYTLLDFPKTRRKELLVHIETQLETIFLQNPNVLAYSVFENWDLKEKLAKFIFNSSNVYNFFGYEHRHPFMDHALFDFFQTLPYSFKRHKKLYDFVLQESFFKPYQLNFKGVFEETSFRLKQQQLKNAIWPLLPSFIKNRYKIKNDPTNYAEITGYLIHDMQNRGVAVDLTGKNFNSIIVQWYLNRLSRDDGSIL